MLLRAERCVLVLRLCMHTDRLAVDLLAIAVAIVCGREARSLRVDESEVAVDAQSSALKLQFEGMVEKFASVRVRLRVSDHGLEFRSE